MRNHFIRGKSNGRFDLGDRKSGKTYYIGNQQNHFEQDESDDIFDKSDQKPYRPKNSSKITYTIADGSKKNDGRKYEPGVRLVGYKYLLELSEKDVPDITCEILNPKSAFATFLGKHDIQADWLFLITKIIAKVCSSEFKGTRSEMLNQICCSGFLTTVSFYLGDISFQKVTTSKLPSFMNNLTEFYSSVIDLLPSVAFDKDFTKFILKTKTAIECVKMEMNITVDESIVHRLDALNDKLQDHKNMLDKPVQSVERKSYAQFMSNQPPPDDFRKLSLYPTSEDLFRDSFGFVRPNKVEGAYDDVDHYLDVQFRLMREDFIDPIRTGLNQYFQANSAASRKGSAEATRMKYKFESLRLYPKCVFLEVQQIQQYVSAFVLCFDPNHKIRIKWEYSKRFMYGSLLLFTCDNFNTFFYGTVANRDLKMLKDGKILVTFPNDMEVNEGFLSKEFLMAESEVFLEPYFLVMKSLKTLSETNFPMKRYIVDGNSTTLTPNYFYNEDRFLFNISQFRVDPFEWEMWPTHDELNLDVCQHRAFVKALTSEFCVIQGPPGTGKTFIGLKIVETLLQNIRLNPNKIRTPIMIVCYTNHALDQFLEGILLHTTKIVRVGSQSKSELLKDFNLRGHKRMNQQGTPTFNPRLGPVITNIRREVKKGLDEVKRTSHKKKQLDEPEGILGYDVLQTVMTKYQRMVLTSEEILLKWLLKYEPKLKGTQHKSKSDKNVTRDENDEKEEESESEESEEVFKPLVVIFENTATELAFISFDYALQVGKLPEIEEQLLYLYTLSEEDIEDLAKYRSTIVDLEYSMKIYKTLEEQLKNRNFTAETYKTVVKKDVGYLEFSERWVLYWSWIEKIRENVVKELQAAESKYRNLLAQYEEVKQMEDIYVIQAADVVGMTTTCAARLNRLVNEVKPAILLVEEAAEVLESHIVTSLTASCQQVILIGDHKQLRPSSAVYKLATEYHIDVSLFERMVKNGMDCPMLNVQHRVRPEISSLITPLIYSDLKNDRSVYMFDNVKGMSKNLFFLEHNNYELQEQESSSRKNDFEAGFAIELCRYLILQGYKPEQITILTTYTGQMYLLREKKQAFELMKHVKCIVVDKYQGEENEIIILSLVRSNEEAKIGFLKTENRVCVALSRAKKGLYIIGNMDNLSKSSPNLWGKIRENLQKQQAIGKEMQLYCSRHDIHTNISCARDFDRVREGGCSNSCGELLECGHLCKRLCHTLDREHKEVKCREPCERNCQRELHRCKKFCFEECGKCTHVLTWDLSCGHKKKLWCSVDEKTFLCDTMVNDLSPICKHEIKRKCHAKPEDAICLHDCEDRLECGHKCEQKCHKMKDPEHLEYKCQKACARLNKHCAYSHTCGKLCFEECGVCSIYVNFTLKCGHEKRERCSVDIEKIKCFKDCEKICPDCNRKCGKKCHEECSPCSNIVEKKIPECGHKVKIECHLRPERKHCKSKCKFRLPCGHVCAAKCCQQCGSVACRELVKKYNVQGLCGHQFVRKICSDTTLNREDLLQYCDAPCDALLECGDPCKSTCGKCWQGRLHAQCQENCGSVSICGHSCKYPCKQMCPPCGEQCSYCCQHSKCTKKCGKPCVQCKEQCEWMCVHKRCTKRCGELCDRDPCYEPCPKKMKCSHPCIGYCGEPCPPKCRECNPEITDIMFGYEDEPDARFVYLEDCKHTIESQALDMHLNASPEGGEIVMKVCPLCKTPITRTLGYMSYVKKTYMDILKVKTKIFGTDKVLKEKQTQLFLKIKKLSEDSKINARITRLNKITKMLDEYSCKVKTVEKGSSTISNSELMTIDFFYNVLVDINSRLEDLCVLDSDNKRLRKSDAVEKIVKLLSRLLARMHEPDIHINKQLSQDITLELRRYHKMVDYALMLHNPSYLSKKNDLNISKIATRINGIVFGINIFDSKTEENANKAFKELQDVLKSNTPLTQEEKRMIHLAMSVNFHGGANSRGHWFTCSKGHYYCITECGGAMQIAQCPECGENIGGEHHTYVNTIRVASDMEGAQHPSWSAQNNVLNYQF